MKTLHILAATAALAAAHALAQSPEVAKVACEPKPVYPGLAAMKSDVEVKAFEGKMKDYKECIVKYISDRKTAVKAHQEAENAAAKEYNETMAQIRTAQEMALKEQEAAKASAAKNEPASPRAKGY